MCMIEPCEHLRIMQLVAPQKVVQKPISPCGKNYHNFSKFATLFRLDTAHRITFRAHSNVRTRPLFNLYWTKITKFVRNSVEVIDFRDFFDFTKPKKNMKTVQKATNAKFNYENQVGDIRYK